MKKKKAAGRGGDFFASQAWKAVNVGDELLLGAEEFGFMGLEELDPKDAGAWVAFGR